MLTLSVALALAGTSYSVVNAEELNGGGDLNGQQQQVGKLAESCILVHTSSNLSTLEDIALNLPDGLVWIEKDNGVYSLKARLDNTQINDFKAKLGNLRYISCQTDYQKWIAKREKLTLKDLGFGDDVYIEGNNPFFRIIFPMYANFEKGKFFADFSVSPIVRGESNIAIKINNMAVKILKPRPDQNAFYTEVPIKKDTNRRFIEVAIDGYLRAGENICDDLNTKNLYLRVNSDRTGFYVIRNLWLRNVKNFFEDYNKNYYVKEVNNDTLKLAYYIPATIRWLKVNVLPLSGDILPSSKVIAPTTPGKINVGKDNVADLAYIGTPDIISPKGVKALLTSLATEIKVKNRKENVRKAHEVSLRDLGIKTQTINGVGVLTLRVPFDTARVGGIPDKLHLVLRVASSAVDKHDRVNLELLVNGGLVKSYSVNREVNGITTYDIEIPSSLLQAGINKIDVKLNYYPSSDRCIGAVPKVNLTLLDDSYFYWNSAKKEVNSIRDFLNLANGRVAVIVDDEALNVYALRLMNILGQLNSNIDKIDVFNSVKRIEENPSKYDYIIVMAKNPQYVLDRAEAPVKLDKNGFTIVDTERDEVLFSFKPEDKVAVMEVVNYKDKPTLLVTAMNGIDVLKSLYNFNYININTLVGNVAFIKEDDYSTFSVGQRLKVHYVVRKGISYYWNKYKALIITLLALLVVLFEIFIFRNLVRNKKNNNNNNNSENEQ